MKILLFFVISFCCVSCVQQVENSKPKFIMEGKIKNVEYLQGSRRSAPATIIHFEDGQKLAIKYYQNIVFTNRFIYVYRKDGFAYGCGYILTNQKLDE